MQTCQQYDCIVPCNCVCTLVVAQKLPIVWVFGVRGSGLNYHLKKFVRQFPDYKRVVINDIINREISKGSEKGFEIRELVDDGDYSSVPTEIIINLIEKEMAKHKNVTGFIIEGLISLEHCVSFEHKIGSPDCLLHLTCPDALIVERVKRRSAEDSSFMLPSDDEASILTRIEDYGAHVKPIFNAYQRQLVEINNQDDKIDIYNLISRTIRGVTRTKKEGSWASM